MARAIQSPRLRVLTNYRRATSEHAETVELSVPPTPGALILLARLSDVARVVPGLGRVSRWLWSLYCRRMALRCGFEFNISLKALS